jgi:hypothetical protein
MGADVACCMTAGGAPREATWGFGILNRDFVIVSALSTEVQAMQYPPAAASAMVLVLFVAVLVAVLMRVVDVRNELVSQGDVASSGRQGHTFGGGARPLTFYALALLFGAYLVFLYGPMLVIYVLSFQGPDGGVTFPMVGVSLVWFENIVKPGQMADIPVSFGRSLVLASASGDAFLVPARFSTSLSPVW